MGILCRVCSGHPQSTEKHLPAADSRPASATGETTVWAACLFGGWCPSMVCCYNSSLPASSAIFRRKKRNAQVLTGSLEGRSNRETWKRRNMYRSFYPASDSSYLQRIGRTLDLPQATLWISHCGYSAKSSEYVGQQRHSPIQYWTPKRVESFWRPCWTLASSQQNFSPRKEE